MLISSHVVELVNFVTYNSLLNASSDDNAASVSVSKPMQFSGVVELISLVSGSVIIGIVVDAAAASTEQDVDASNGVIVSFRSGDAST